MDQWIKYQEAIKQAMNEQNMKSILENVYIADKKRDNVTLNEIIFTVYSAEDAIYEYIKNIGAIYWSYLPRLKSDAQETDNQSNDDDEKNGLDEKPSDQTQIAQSTDAVDHLMPVLAS